MNKQNKKQTLRYKERFDGCQMEVGLDGIGEKKGFLLHVLFIVLMSMLNRKSDPGQNIPSMEG